MKTYTQIKMDNKSSKVMINYAPNCKVHFTYHFNNISGGYSGLFCESYTNTVRGLLRAIPDFFERLSEHSYEKDLQAMGFTEIEPTESEILIYGKMFATI